MIRAGYDMRHITLTLMREDLPSAGLVLAELAAFAPDERPLLESELPEIPGDAFRTRMRRAWGHFDRLVSLLGELPRDTASYPPLVPRRERLVEIDQWLAAAWQQCAPCEAKLHEIEDRTRELHELETSLREFADFDVDLGKLRGEHHHVDMRLGSIPSDNLTRLSEVLALSQHVVVNLSGDEENLRILVAGRREDADMLDGVLHAAAFQPLSIPESFDGNPDALAEELQQRRDQLVRESLELQGQLDNWSDTNRHQLLRAQQLLEAAEPYVNLRGAARTRGPLAALQGWIPARFEQLLCAQQLVAVGIAPVVELSLQFE
nr:hypothetical protein [Gammaproteobacteria bacterium]